ncbi:MAG: hypothetical protein IIB05_09590 [Bacteroidetes bacterium]|nr:hypothetical protein [Bacteroidota bacterium]
MILCRSFHPVVRFTILEAIRSTYLNRAPIINYGLMDPTLLIWILLME